MSYFSSTLIVNTHASTYPLMDQSEEFIPSLQKYIMLGALSPDITIAQAIKANIRHNSLSSVSKYMKAAKNSYVYKLPETKLYSELPSNDVAIENIINVPGWTYSSTQMTTPSWNTEASTQLYHKYQRPRDVVWLGLVPGSDSVWKVNSKDMDGSDPKSDYLVLDRSEGLVINYISGSDVLPLVWRFTEEQMNSIYEVPFDEPFPVIPVKTDGEYLDDVDIDAFKSASLMLVNLGLDLNSINEQIKDNNPGGGSEDYRVTDAFVSHGVSIYTQSQAGLEYLFNMFNALIPDVSITRQSLYLEEKDYNFRLSFTNGNQFLRSGTLTNNYESNFVGSSLYIRRRGNAGTYHEIEIHDLSAEMGLDSSQSVKIVSIPVSTDTTSPEYANFRIPLDYTIFNSLSRKQYKETLLHETAIITLHHVQEYEQEWYESGILGDLITIIAVIAAVWTGGASLTWAFVGKVAAAAALKELIVRHVNDPILQAILNIAVDMFVFGSFGSDSTNLQNIGTVLNGVGAAGQQYFKLEFASLEQEIESFTKSVAEMEEELKDAKDLLNPGAYEDVLMASTLTIPRMGESPSMFYTRSLTKNPGALVIDSIHRYHENKLTLPKVAPMAGAQYSQLTV